MNTRVRLDSRDLVKTAAVWRTPDLIGVSILAALAGSTFLVVFVLGAAFIKQNSPIFNENAKLSRQHYERCILNFVNQGVRASNTRAHLTCVTEADAYRARLESRGN